MVQIKPVTSSHRIISLSGCHLPRERGSLTADDWVVCRQTLGNVALNRFSDLAAAFTTWIVVFCLTRAVVWDFIASDGYSVVVVSRCW